MILDAVRPMAGLFLIAACAAAPLRAQGTKADYERADALRDRMKDKVFRAAVKPRWLAGGDRFWYRNDLPGEAREFVVVDAAKGTRGPAFDHAKLAEALTKLLGKPVSPTRLPVDRLEPKDEGRVLVEVESKTYRFDEQAGTLEPGDAIAAEPERREDRPRRESPRGEESPDGSWTARVRNQNVYLRKKGSSEEHALSVEGTESDAYEPGVYWSPDSKRLVAIRTARGDDRKVHMVASSPADRLQPKLVTIDYLKPGDRVPASKPHLFDVEACREIPVRDELFANPWSVDDVRWSPDSKRFTFLYNQRGHQVLRLVGIDAETGAASAVVDERSKTFIDYAHKTFLHHVDATRELIWMSERSGWNHLYLIDAATGAVKNPITTGAWVVRGVDRVDDVARQVWFRAGGIRPGQDPYYVHHARVNFDGTGLVVFTEADGHHQVELSPDRRFAIDAHSRVDRPPVVELRRTGDGSLVVELERADVSALAAAGWNAPEQFAAKGRDGATDIYGVIYRPSTFDPGKTYPVIELIYAGPQGAFVPKDFAPVRGGQALAELGFVVVQVDGMGTNWRSKAFHDVCWKNLADAGFPDRIRWMRAAAAHDPALDLSRVGVYGGSAGGQNAVGALLFHGDFYKAAAADCGCHDNRMDKIWWNELWMGWPLGPHYEAQSNVTNVHKLRGKLLLTVGELDRNVDPASTMQLVNALIKADKDFELVVFPGADHGAGASPYGERRRRDFFVRHLLGVEPRRE